jgi:hypothetical protein
MDPLWLREPYKRQREDILTTSRQVLTKAGKSRQRLYAGLTPGGSSAGKSV